MGDITGFKKVPRDWGTKQSPEQRVKHFKEFVIDASEQEQSKQASRCMDCGVPFCHSGCPLGNLIPAFNEAVFQSDWKLAFELLSSTNNFPEFTGRICPAPCESACVLGINNDPVSIESIEKSIAEKAFEAGWVEVKQPEQRSPYSVAIVGSGPAGLAAAEQLNQAGHTVTIFEKSAQAGGLLRYGIPDFKLDKSVVERRVELMRNAGIRFQLNTNVGFDVDPNELREQFDALLLCGGSAVPRDLQIEGRHLSGINYAMDFLSQSNKRVAGEAFPEPEITVDQQEVIVIGGGDTGSDCIGTSNRLGASSIRQIEIMHKPGLLRSPENPWPHWPFTLSTSSSHEEGCLRQWAIRTKAFVSENGKDVSGIKVVNVEWSKNEQGKYQMTELRDTERILPCTRVFLAMGFTHPTLDGMIEKLGVELDQRKNVHTQDFRTSIDKVFAAGDMNRGQSLVVWAISEGRQAAESIHRFLCGTHSNLAAQPQGAIFLD